MRRRVGALWGAMRGLWGGRVLVRALRRFWGYCGWVWCYGVLWLGLGVREGWVLWGGLGRCEGWGRYEGAL